MESCSLRDAGLKLALWFGVSMSYGTNGVGEPESKKPAEMPISEPGRYGRYDDLAKWIEKRSLNGSFSRLEQSA